MAHDFAERLAAGEAQEARLDRYFAPFYTIRRANAAEQRAGIDRHFADRRGGYAFTVEYKADFAAARTGNAFIETVSVDTEGLAGWAVTSRADWLLYLLPTAGELLALPMAAVRERVPLWLARYPTRPAQNREYRTWGICVPLGEARKAAAGILKLAHPARALPALPVEAAP